MLTCFFVAGYLISSINSFASASIESAKKDNHNFIFLKCFLKGKSTWTTVKVHMGSWHTDEDTVAEGAKISLGKTKQNNRNPKILKDHCS